MTTSFQELMERIQVQKEHLLDELVAAEEQCEREEDRKELIVHALAQYEDFYVEKSRAAHRDVFQLFSPPWCSSLECSFLWITGFRPTSLFQLATSSLHDLSSDQLHRLRSSVTQTKSVVEADNRQPARIRQIVLRLKKEIKKEEKALSEEEARIQERIASPPIMCSLREIGQYPHSAGEAGQVVQSIRLALEALVVNADALRTKTATNLVDTLTSAQGVRFLVAATRLELNMRVKGTDRDVMPQVCLHA